MQGKVLLKNQAKLLSVLALLLSSCLTSDELLKLREPQFTRLQNGNRC